MMKRMFAVFVLMVLALAGWIGFRSVATVVVDGSAVQSPDQVVDAFYQAYIGSIGDRFSDDFHNPLVERTYRDLPQLSPALVKEIDAKLEAADFIVADPFLCAQDIPGEVWVKAVEVNDDRAVVSVETDFADHQMAVILDRMPEGWQITAINCKQ